MVRDARARATRPPAPDTAITGLVASVKKEMSSILSSSGTMDEPVEAPGLRMMRRLLLLLLTVAMIGTAVDLMLLDHHEDFWQVVPLGLIALGVVSVVVAAMRGGAGAVAVMRVTMALFICAGFVGMGLHYAG